MWAYAIGALLASVRSADAASAGSLVAALPEVLYTSSRGGCEGPVGLRLLIVAVVVLKSDYQ